jgi:ABC-2 type transport system ATP-binding protein
MSTEASLIFDRVAKRYGRTAALKGVSFTIAPGSVTGIIGPNGSGKSTLLKLMAGALYPDQGEIHVPPDLARMGLQTEAFSVPIRMSGRAWLAHHGRMDGSIPDAFFENLIRRLNMASVLDRSARGYSKGMLKKLGILQAFLGSPPVVLLDEPFEGLDPVDRHQFMQVVRAYAAVGNLVLISSHILFELDEACDRILILKQGELLHDLGREREDLPDLYLRLFKGDS